MKMLMQHVNATPIPPSQRTELSIPRELDELVMACWPRTRATARRTRRSFFRWHWNARRAELGSTCRARWWERHLPELTGPLSIHEPDIAMNRAMAAS
jgi:hypothetical protein